MSITYAQVNNHACIPPVCFKRKLLAAGAIVNLYVTVGGAAKPVVNVTAQFPKLLQQGLAELQKMANLDCDGCVCFRLKLPNPPLTTTTPPIMVETNSDTDAEGVVTVYEYRVEGAKYVLTSLGICCPPGTQIKVGEKWVPVEEASKTSHALSPGQAKGGVGKKTTDDKKRGKPTIKTRSRPRRR